MAELMAPITAGECPLEGAARPREEGPVAAGMVVALLHLLLDLL